MTQTKATRTFTNQRYLDAMEFKRLDENPQL